MKKILKKFTICTTAILGAFCVQAAQWNEDEAYDPTDWFDGNNYEYDDTLGLDYTTPGIVTYEYWVLTPGESRESSTNMQARSNQNRSKDQQSQYSENEPKPRGSQDQKSSTRYQNQNPSTPREATRFGWHYDWDGANNRYVRDYGWHDHYYDATPNERSYVSSRQERPGQAANRTSYTRTIRGRVDNVKTLDLQSRAGQSDKHRIVQLSMEDGRNVLVECGPEGSNQKVRFNQGDEVVVTGRTGYINGRRVLFAERINLDGEPFRIARNTSSNKSSQQNQNVRTQFSGLIQDFRTVWLSDNNRTNHVVEITLQDNERLLVDFGKNSLSSLNLDYDDPITVRGSKKVINGRTVIQAAEVWLDGQKIISRDAQAMATRRN